MGESGKCWEIRAYGDLVVPVMTFFFFYKFREDGETIHWWGGGGGVKGENKKLTSLGQCH